MAGNGCAKVSGSPPAAFAAKAKGPREAGAFLMFPIAVKGNGNRGMVPEEAENSRRTGLIKLKDFGSGFFTYQEKYQDHRGPRRKFEARASLSRSNGYIDTSPSRADQAQQLDLASYSPSLQEHSIDWYCFQLNWRFLLVIDGMEAAKRIFY